MTLLAVLLAAVATATVSPTAFSGRGNHYFRSTHQCAMSGIGERDAYACNRVSIDDSHSRVLIDEAAKRITVENAHRYEDETTIADVLLAAVVTSKRGQRGRAGIYIKIEKDGRDVSAEVRAQPTIREALTDADFDAYVIEVTDGKSTVQVFNRKKGLNAVRNPGTLSRVAGALLGIENNLEGVSQKPSDPGFRLADLSVTLLGKPILRAQLIAVDGVHPKAVAKGPKAMMAVGVWQVKLTGLSSLLPKDAFKRPMFHLGLDEEPLLQTLREEGLKDGESLTFTFSKGKGLLTYRKTKKAFSNAADLARAYVEFDFLGSILVHQATLYVRRNMRRSRQRR